MKKKAKHIILGMFILLVVTLLYLNYLMVKDRLERLYDGPKKEIEYQVGNYVNGGLYVNGCTYLLTDNSLYGYYDETGEWVSQPDEVIYKVDNQGNHEEFYVFDDLKFPNNKPWMYYYDGWLYFDAIDLDPKSTKPGHIFRISEDGKEFEDMLESANTILFGIRDDYLIYANEFIVYCKDLKDLKDGIFSGMKKIDNHVLTRDLYCCFFQSWIYNCKNISLIEYEYDKNKRQYYDGNTYTILKNIEYTGDTAYEKRKLIRRVYNKVKIHTKEYQTGEVTDEELHSDVLCFNIFDDKLYYVVFAEDKNELWCSDMDGSNAQLLYQTEFDTKLYCKNIIVSEHNIICDFGPGTDSAITDRYIIGKQSEYVNHISFMR